MTSKKMKLDTEKTGATGQWKSYSRIMKPTCPGRVYVYASCLNIQVHSLEMLLSYGYRLKSLLWHVAPFLSISGLLLLEKQASN